MTMVRCSTLLSALLLGFCFLPSAAQCQTKPSPSSSSADSPGPKFAYDYSREAVVYEKLATVYDFNADGTGEKTTTFAARIQSDAAVRQLGVITLPYAAQNERPEIVYLRVRKKDGTLVQ